MCGIAGLILPLPATTEQEPHHIVKLMSDQLARRGPDASGVWVDDRRQVALGHRRLSIVDLSVEGFQPMMGAHRRFCIVFNGEIYNHKAIAADLRKLGCQFRGHSDTEVLVTAFELWGVRATLPKLEGMFAFAAWDAEAGKLYLARDRLGEKPLYYGHIGDDFVFASELKALEVHPRWRQHSRLNQNSLALYLQYGYVPTPYSIYENIHKLAPACLVEVTPGAEVRAKDTLIGKPYTYWDIEHNATQPKLRLSDKTKYVRALDDVLRQVVADQIVADVPLGGFLSGGVDSTAIVAIMQSVSSRPVNTFTIGFEEPEFNEAEHAKGIAKILGTHHTELYVSSQMALDLVPELPRVYDEPFADSSQIPTVLLTKMARQHVTVCLSGDAGDELFCGYNRYVYADKLARLSSLCLPSIRRGIASLLQVIPAEQLFRFAKSLPLLRSQLGNLNNANVRPKMAKLVSSLRADGLLEIYRGLVSYWPTANEVMRTQPRALPQYLSNDFLLSGGSTLEQLMYWDLRSYLPDDNLAKVDRAAMYNSLETRLPFLNHRVVEFALSLPLELKVRGGVTKWILREVVHQYVPQQVMDRPKMGFSVPVSAWLKGALRDWAEDLLSENRLNSDGVLDSKVVRRCWADHLDGRADNSMKLWALLMFQAWRARVSVRC